jgi:hypothetical protein
MTSRFGSFLKEDLAPRVAASLRITLSTERGAREYQDPLPEETETTVTSREELWGKEHAGKASKGE